MIKLNLAYVLCIYSLIHIWKTSLLKHLNCKYINNHVFSPDIFKNKNTKTLSFQEVLQKFFAIAGLQLLHQLFWWQFVFNTFILEI